MELGGGVKNYKELCELLNQPMLNGKSKTYQLKDFKRYFEYQKVGQKFVITDIYDEPLKKDDRRKNGNNSIYVKYVETILLNYLAQQEKFTCTLKKNQIQLLLGMVNSRYNKVPIKELEDIDDRVTSWEVNHFYQRCNQKIERILFTSLTNLKNRCLLSYQEQIIIVDADDNHFLAMDGDIRKLDAVKKSVLGSMGLISLIQVYCKFKSDEFYKKVNAINTDAKQKCINQNEKWNEAYSLKVKEWESFGLGEWKPQEKDVGVFKYPHLYIEAQEILSEELLRIGSRAQRSFEIKVEEEKSSKELEGLFRL